MQSVIDSLQNLVRLRTQHGKNPLVALYTLEPRVGLPISNLSIDQKLVHAWVTLMGVAFCRHQSLSLAALRRGEPVALLGGGAVARQTVHLLTFEMMLQEPHRCALLLLPNDEVATQHLAEIEQFNHHLQTPLHVEMIGKGRISREVITAHIILTTPDVLHERLLRYYDRAWHMLWSRLHMLVFAQLDDYCGVASAHLSALLLRMSRLMTTAPLILATITERPEVHTSLMELIGQPWMMIPANDTPRPTTNVALWNAGFERLDDVAKLANRYQRQGYRVSITCDQTDIPILLPMVNTKDHTIHVGTIPHEAPIQICTRTFDFDGVLRDVLEGSFAHNPLLTMLVLGHQPIDRTLARLHSQEHVSSTVPLLNHAAPMWLTPPMNAYVSSKHLLCAANEHVLTSAEVQSWHAEDMVAHLEKQRQLVRLPGQHLSWKPSSAVGNPYENFSLCGAGSMAIALCDEQGACIGHLEPGAFDRWGFHGASLPPACNTYRVIERNDEQGMLTLRPEKECRRTFPLRHSEITIREKRENRTIYEQPITWGRVVVNEKVYGYCETKWDSKTVEHTMVSPLATQWTAPAVWVDLSISLDAHGQLIGWSLAWALPFKVLCQWTDIVPFYDDQLNRLYIVDGQPGGNGLSAWIYQNLEELLPLAYDIALDCCNDPLMERMARNDMDWLLSLLSNEQQQSMHRLSVEFKQPVTAFVSKHEQHVAPSSKEQELPVSVKQEHSAIPSSKKQEFSAVPTIAKQEQSTVLSGAKKESPTEEKQKGTRRKRTPSPTRQELPTEATTYSPTSASNERGATERVTSPSLQEKTGPVGESVQKASDAEEVEEKPDTSNREESKTEDTVSPHDHPFPNAEELLAKLRARKADAQRKGKGQKR